MEDDFKLWKVINYLHDFAKYSVCYFHCKNSKYFYLNVKTNLILKIFVVHI